MNIPDRLNTALADRYRLERSIGEGGMATVYLAHDIRHDRAVAIKVLRPDLAAVIGGDRFLTEIRTTANLQHPHILPLFDSGAVDGFLYYVMPFVEGESLRQRLDRERQLPVDEAIRIARDVAGALDYAHRHNVIHRDIKPANILLHDGRPVVADFGIALALSAAGGGRLTETGLSLGTPYYMSPEQATAEREHPSRLVARRQTNSLQLCKRQHGLNRSVCKGYGRHPRGKAPGTTRRPAPHAVARKGLDRVPLERRRTARTMDDAARLRRRAASLLALRGHGATPL